jgi:hypothetical protein
MNQAQIHDVIIYSLIDLKCFQQQRSVIILSFFTIITRLLTSFGVSLLDKSKSDTFSLWNGDLGGLTITNNNDVTESGGERVSLGVLNMADLERTWMLFDRGKSTDSTNIVSSNEHDVSSDGELNDTSDSLGLEIELYTKIAFN